MSLIIRAPGVIASPIARSAPTTLTPAAHAIVPARTPARVGAPITQLPTDVGNAVSIISPPPLVSEGRGYTYARLDGIAHALRLVASPAISLLNFTALFVARLKSIDGTQTLWRGMPPGGNRSDLSLINGRLTWVSDSGQTATHSWAADVGLHVFTVAQASGAATVGVDGIEQSTALTAAPLTGLTIGEKRGGGYTALDLAGMWIIPSTLPAADRLAEVRNLGAAYGIAVA